MVTSDLGGTRVFDEAYARAPDPTYRDPVTLEYTLSAKIDYFFLDRSSFEDRERDSREAAT